LCPSFFFFVSFFQIVLHSTVTNATKIWVDGEESVQFSIAKIVDICIQNKVEAVIRLHWSEAAESLQQAGIVFVPRCKFAPWDKRRHGVDKISSCRRSGL
jgi:hypothetical protein